MIAVPVDVLELADRELSSLSADRRELFELRLRRWWSDLWSGLHEVYGQQAPALAGRLVTLAARAHRDRDDELHRLDLERTLRPDWLQSPEMVGYAAYTERFAGDLPGIVDRIPYLRELGVGYLHLMPLFTPRPGDNDGGYAVADHRTVRADLGTVEDLRAVAGELRRNGISLVVDLVLNHVAREHEWARRARAGDPRYRAYFHVYPDRTEPDAWEASLPEVFPDFAPGNFTFDDDLDGWVWTTFNEWQWDLDWSNPDVLCEFADLVLFLANLGVEVLRLDAIAFLYKRKGTSCQGQPEVHAITQALRAVARIACPAVAFKAEAIVSPRELVAYLGRGRYAGKVSDLAYHNSLMVHAWSMLASKDVRLAAHALSSLPPTPPGATWVTYLRCHDDIGWAIDDGDAAAVGLDGHLHRAFLSEWYAGRFPGSPARGLTFQHNPRTDDRRISGTAASLVGLEAATTPEEVETAIAALRLAHALVMGWGGIPVLWSGDELAQPNDPGWATEAGHADDNRWVHRPRLDDDRVARRHDRDTIPGRVFGDLCELSATRRSLPHLHASVTAEVVEVDDPGVLVILRRHPVGDLVAVHNVTPEWRPWPGHRVHELGMADAVDTITGTAIPWGDDGNVWLAPYAAMWLVAGP